MAQATSDDIVTLSEWLSSNGGRFHPDVSFRAGPSGYSVIAGQDILPGTTVVSCPFKLAITPEVSRQALISVLTSTDLSPLDTWSERQLICSYICLHWILGESSNRDVLKHWPYLNTLPSADKLLTPLHFTATEIEAFRGSNLYGATHDRQRDWQQEWRQCQELFSAANSPWGSEFTWERYLTAATYLSSRAFPSTLLSPEPSLVPTSTSHPILLPGVDALNHARAHPVSWVVSATSPVSYSELNVGLSENSQSISLVLRTGTQSGHELFNNYGPKPNAELILGYGFSLPHNPDDTIVLKIGGAAPGSGSQPKYEVGRDASGAELVWGAILAAICEDPEEVTVEDELDAAEMLVEMAEDLRNRLPQPRAAAQDLRPEVATMLEHYLEGQRDIMHSLIAFARDKQRQAIQQAREQGLQIVDEETEGEE
ncbi:SET domain-containing protein [Fomitopsis serialis]|uniref:SET domain-containing protein n=1 Tax=Fomitopsis serialis TaxID=139415 RepID=UPI002008DF19|nr:SET domain-containing protein [Neoantrodia serialis]KAH9915320.1 SET domain-containing protein [Neoantrodia serialis]